MRFSSWPAPSSRFKRLARLGHRRLDRLPLRQGSAGGRLRCVPALRVVAGFRGRGRAADGGPQTPIGPGSVAGVPASVGGAGLARAANGRSGGGSGPGNGTTGNAGGTSGPRDGVELRGRRRARTAGHQRRERTPGLGRRRLQNTFALGRQHDVRGGDQPGRPRPSAGPSTSRSVDTVSQTGQRRRETPSTTSATPPAALLGQR